MEGKNEKKKKDKRKSLNITFKMLRYFIPIAWKIKKSYCILRVLNIIITTILPFIDIFVFPMILDELLGAKRTSVLVTYVLILVLGDGILGRLSSLCSMTADKYNTLYENYLEAQLVHQCMSIDFGLTENKAALDQIHKAREGISWYSGGIQGIVLPFLQIIKDILVLAGVVVLIIKNAPVLLLVSIIAVILFTLTNQQKIYVQNDTFRSLAKTNRIFGYTLFELMDFRYAKDIRLYGALGMMMEKTNKEIKVIVGSFKHQQDTTIKWDIFDGIIRCAQSGIIYIYLGIRAIHGIISIGIFSQMVTAVNTFRNSLNDIVQNLQIIVQRSEYINEYIKFMEYPPVLEKGTKKPEQINHVFEIRNVSFTYPDTTVKVLDHVSLKIPFGEHLSVVGLNGAGKTTFIKLLCRLYDVSDGEILLDGVNIKEYDYDEYMKIFAVVFQDFKLLAFSMKENITLDSEASEQEIMEICKLAGLEEKVENLEKGLDTMMFKYFDEDGVELSGGEQQKLAIARALYKNAPVVILDEPTAALDPIAEYDIYRQFNQLVGGKTAIYISHRLSSCKFCDHIAVFSEGTIKEYGTHDELVHLQNGIYAEMFQAQAQYYQ